MAERLPKYRRLGVGIPGVPSVNFVQTGRAQAAVFNTISKALDQMSDFAYKQAEQEAITTGTEFGAANAPTAEQLKLAGEDAEKYIPGFENDTVFAKAARKAAIQTVQADMETATRSEITRLRLTAIDEDMPVATFTTNVQNAINGYTAAMAEISPAAAVNFSAGMAANANSAVLAYAEKLSEKQTRQARIDAELAADAIIVGPVDDDDNSNSSISDVMAAGFTPATSTQEYVSVADKMQNLRNQVELAASAAGPEMIRAKLKAFDAAVDGAYTTAVSDWAMQTPGALSQIAGRSKIKNAKIRDLWANMTADQKRKAEDDIMSRLSRNISMEEQINSQNERKRKDQAELVVVDIVKARMSGDMQTVNEKLDTLSLLDPDKFNTLAMSVSKEGAIDRPDVVQRLQIAAVDGVLTMDMVLDQSQYLSYSTMSQMFEKVKANRSTDHTQAMKYVKNALMPEIPDGMVLFDSNNQDAKRAAVEVADIETALIFEIRRNPEVNRLQFVKPLVEEMLSTRKDAEADAQKAAEKVLTQLKGGGPQGLGLGPEATVEDAITALRDTDKFDQALKDKYIERLQPLRDKD